jgi:plastocyanin
VVVAVLMTSGAAARADYWKATAGAQSGNKERQVLAFFPNELWIHAGDAVTWQFDSDEKHTVTFLKTGATRPSFQAGVRAAPWIVLFFAGSACVNSDTIDRTSPARRVAS